MENSEGSVLEVTVAEMEDFALGQGMRLRLREGKQSTSDLPAARIKRFNLLNSGHDRGGVLPAKVEHPLK